MSTSQPTAAPSLNRKQMADAFNEWMRRYTDEPERFSSEFAAVRRFLAEQSEGEPSYGHTCAEYMLELSGDTASQVEPASPPAKPAAAPKK